MVEILDLLDLLNLQEVLDAPPHSFFILNVPKIRPTQDDGREGESNGIVNQKE